MSDLLRKELEKVRTEIDAVFAAGGSVEDAVRVGLDHSMKALPTDLKFLRAHGFEVEPGSYFLGSQLAAIVTQGMDPKDAIHHPIMGALLHEYMARARKLLPEVEQTE